MADYPQAEPKHCINEEDRGKYGLRRPPEVWRVTLRLSPRCMGFLSQRKYPSFEAANRAAHHLNNQITGETDER